MQNRGGTLARALSDRLSSLVSSNQGNRDLQMILPFLPLLKTHVLAQSDEDIRRSLQQVKGFIDDVLNGE